MFLRVVLTPLEEKDQKMQSFVLEEIQETELSVIRFWHIKNNNGNIKKTLFKKHANFQTYTLFKKHANFHCKMELQKVTKSTIYEPRSSAQTESLNNWMVTFEMSVANFRDLLPQQNISSSKYMVEFEMHRDNFSVQDGFRNPTSRQHKPAPSPLTREKSHSKFQPHDAFKFLGPKHHRPTNNITLAWKRHQKY